jgi:hypothetical protein
VQAQSVPAERYKDLREFLDAINGRASQVDPAATIRCE